MSTVKELAARVDALERRLRRAEDFEAIVNLKSRYGQLADSRYTLSGPRPADEIQKIARDVTELFTEDAVWDGGASLGTAHGRDEIYERFCQPSLGFTWHYFVKPRIDVDGDRAWGTWDILAPCTSSEGRALWMAGYEEDEYERVGDDWQHKSMVLTVVFMAPYERGWAPRGEER